MKAQVFYEPRVMELKEVPIPEVGENEVLVKVKACGVCGSDVAYYYGGSPLETENGKGPLILGHEFAGEVVDVGGIAKKLGLFSVGDRVLANPVQNCNACRNCARGEANLCTHTKTKGVNVDGAFAEYTVMNYTHLHKIPDGISFEQAALCEPLACASYGVSKLGVKPGDFVVIFGPGAIGLMMLQMVKASGAGKVAMCGILDYGLAKAKELGADYAFNTLDAKSPYYCPDIVAEISRLSDGDMANKVIVPTSAQSALQGALEVSGKRSVIVYFGLPGEDTVLHVPLLDTLTHDKSIQFSWLAPYTWDFAISCMNGKLVDMSPLITHTFRLEELKDALEFMYDNQKTDKIKSVIIF